MKIVLKRVSDGKLIHIEKKSSYDLDTTPDSYQTRIINNKWTYASGEDFDADWTYQLNDCKIGQKIGGIMLDRQFEVVEITDNI